AGDGERRAAIGTLTGDDAETLSTLSRRRRRFELLKRQRKAFGLSIPKLKRWDPFKRPTPFAPAPAGRMEVALGGHYAIWIQQCARRNDFPNGAHYDSDFGPDRRTIVGRNQPRALSTRSTGAKRYAWHGGDD